MEMIFAIFMHAPKGGGVRPVSGMFLFGCPGHAFVKVTQQLRYELLRIKAYTDRMKDFDEPIALRCARKLGK
jgi:hypothetical protein